MPRHDPFDTDIDGELLLNITEKTGRRPTVEELEEAEKLITDHVNGISTKYVQFHDGAGYFNVEYKINHGEVRQHELEDLVDELINETFWDDPLMIVRIGNMDGEPTMYLN